ncbi:MAG TPA: FAD-dependent oxidoreductase [Nevskiaceae bacterium]|nr:FAD-dependent oxidoreductase [Nevskiaceae bacterium]
MSGISRRKLLAGLAAGAATPLLAACGSSSPVAAAGAATPPDSGAGPSGQNAPPPAPPVGNQSAEVVIVGAGYSGLECARALATQGVDVLVLEGRDRVGGRCWNHQLPAPYSQYVVEGGAEFIGPTQDRMYALAKALGIATYTAYNTGSTVNYIDGQRSTYTGRVPSGNLVALLAAQGAITTLDNMATQVPLDKPWTAPKAATWDSQTVEDWMNSNITLGQQAKSLLRLAVIAVFSAEPQELSLLYALFYIHSAGSLNYLLDTAGGAQQDRIVGGSQAIAIAMGQQLGDRILFNAAVRDVDQTASTITVSGDGFSVTAQHAVIAMSPWPAGRLHYTPLNDPASPLAGPMQARLQMMQRRPMGSIWKVHCVYPTPFWRDAGLNGQVTSDAFLPKVTFDNTPPENGAPGVMMGFIDGQDARDALLMTQAQRKANVVQAFTTYFGAGAANPVAYLENNWQAEDFSGGGPVGVAPPGVITAYTTALVDPIGRLHWAGTETSQIWTGYMDGAVRSGERAAQEILAAG